MNNNQQVPDQMKAMQVKSSQQLSQNNQTLTSQNTISNIDIPQQIKKPTYPDTKRRIDENHTQQLVIKVEVPVTQLKPLSMLVMELAWRNRKSKQKMENSHQKVAYNRKMDLKQQLKKPESPQNRRSRSRQREQTQGDEDSQLELKIGKSCVFKYQLDGKQQR